MKRIFEQKFHKQIKITIDQMRELMAEDGELFFPWIISEEVNGLKRVDVDIFIAAYRSLRIHNGLNEEERDEFESVFNKFDQDGSGCISTDEMQRVLTYMGFQPSEEMFYQLVTQADSDESGEIDVSEFLVAMRIYSEMQLEQFRPVFEKFDKDGSGSIDTNELYQAVKNLGYFPTRASIAEAVSIVDMDGGGDLSFDEFFKMMSYLRSTEGFTKDEVAEFKEVYDKFDRDGSGEVSVLELGPILLELGYPTSIDLQQRYIAEVDVDGSGEMDR